VGAYQTCDGTTIYLIDAVLLPCGASGTTAPTSALLNETLPATAVAGSGGGGGPTYTGDAPRAAAPAPASGVATVAARPGPGAAPSAGSDGPARQALPLPVPVLAAVAASAAILAGVLLFVALGLHRRREMRKRMRAPAPGDDARPGRAPSSTMLPPVGTTSAAVERAGSGALAAVRSASGAIQKLGSGALHKLAGAGSGALLRMGSGALMLRAPPGAPPLGSAHSSTGQLLEQRSMGGSGSGSGSSSPGGSGGGGSSPELRPQPEPEEPVSAPLAPLLLQPPASELLLGLGPGLQRAPSAPLAMGPPMRAPSGPLACSVPLVLGASSNDTRTSSPASPHPTGVFGVLLSGGSTPLAAPQALGAPAPPAPERAPPSQPQLPRVASSNRLHRVASSGALAPALAQPGLLQVGPAGGLRRAPSFLALVVLPGGAGAEEGAPVPLLSRPPGDRPAAPLPQLASPFAAAMAQAGQASQAEVAAAAAGLAGGAAPVAAALPMVVPGGRHPLPPAPVAPLWPGGLQHGGSGVLQSEGSGSGELAAGQLPPGLIEQLPL
jgi:hypothetical protein